MNGKGKENKAVIEPDIPQTALTSSVSKQSKK